MDASIRQIGGGPGPMVSASGKEPRQADFAALGRARHPQFDLRGAARLFVQHELSTTERGAANRLRRASNAGDAAAIVCRYYERPADIVGDSAHRAQIANRIFRR